MITQEQQKQGAELLKTLVEKAWESAAFKEQLVNSPIVTIESLTKNKFPKDTKIIVEDQTDSSLIYFNIPRKENIDNFELSDEQLEIVSGGEVGIGVFVGVCAVVALVSAGYVYAANHDK